MDACATRSAINVTCFNEALLGRDVCAATLSDNDAGRIAVQKGCSRKLAYAKKMQKICLGFLHDYYASNGVRLARVESLKNLRDLLTKPFDHTRRWELVMKIGMCPLESALEFERQ